MLEFIITFAIITAVGQLGIYFINREERIKRMKEILGEEN